MKRTFFAALLVGVALATGGGICAPDPGPNPCETDRLGCDDGPTDWSTKTCPDVSGALEVHLAHGDDGTFHEVGEGSVPEVHYGIQGGQHVFLGVRVPNARLDVYDRLRVTFWMGQGADCALPGEPTADVPATCPTSLGRRQVVLGGDGSSALRTAADGAVEELAILMFLMMPPTPGVPAVVAVQVEDPCGRTAMAGYRFVP